MLAAATADPTATGRDFSALQCLLVGGSPITDATIAAGRRVFGDVLYQVFGQTEAIPLTFMHAAGVVRRRAGLHAAALPRGVSAVLPPRDP